MVPAAREQRDRPSRTPLLLGIISGAALVVALIGLVLTSRSDDGGSGIVSNTLQTDPTTVATSAPATTAPTTETSSTLAVDDPPATTASLPPSTVASTSPPSTVASTSPPPTVASTSPPSAVPQQTPAPTEPPQPAPTEPPTPTPAPTEPTTPAPPPTTAASDTAVLDDPLPSGLSSGDVAPALALAQQLGDALAAGDWDVARQLNPALRSLTDAQLESGYGGLDQSAQLLVDARRTNGADSLLVVTVANERNGAQTSLYCIETTVSAGGEVRQTSATTLDRYTGTLEIDDVTSDPAIRDLIRAQCVLP